MPRQQIKDEYEILSEIGAGGMAVVHKAVQKSLDRMVAIKELKKAYHGDAQIVKRFERESRVAASLQHENIVHIYDYWRKPDYAIVMEYVDGVTLADVIDKTGALPIDVGIMIAIQISNALDYAHMRGLVHRDIKPGNVMIKRNGEVKLMDFGIAQSRELDAMTIPGTLIGTPSYMSPEQIYGQQLDARSDVFSFGIVLYEMFTGVKPFMEDDSRPVTAKIVKDPFLPPRRVNRDIPRRLQWLIKKCLRKKPARRYGSMLEVGKKLGRRIAGRTTKAGSLQRIAAYLVSMDVFEAAPEQETMIVTAKVSPIARYRKGILAAAFLLLLAAGAAAYYYWNRPDQTGISLPAFPSIGTSLFTRPQTTASPAPGIVPQEPGTASTGTFTPAASQPASRTLGTPHSTPTASSSLTTQRKSQTSTDRKKASSKKKKKRTVQ
jgi:serine/threonine protein kinase